MTTSERECVDSLVSMGYPYESVLRAMQRQGHNMEQVGLTPHLNAHEFLTHTVNKFVLILYAWVYIFCEWNSVLISHYN